MSQVILTTKRSSWMDEICLRIDNCNRRPLFLPFKPYATYKLAGGHV